MTTRRCVGAERRGALGVAAMVVSSLLGALLMAVFAPTSFAADPGAGAAQATPTPPPTALPPNPAMDARVTTYIQKRFMIADPAHVQLGPVLPTVMNGLFSRTLRVSNDRGQSVTATLYTDAGADHMILSQGIGQIFDLKK